MHTPHRLRRLLQLASLALLWLGTVLHAQEQTAPLKVSRFANSAMQDLAERVMQDASRRAKVPMQFHNVPLQRGLPMADSGELDADIIRPKYIDGRFPNLIRLSVPVITIDFGAYGRIPSVRTMSRDEMRKLTFGVPKGMTAAQKLVEGLKSSEGQSFTALFEMLSAGRFDIAVLPYVEAEIEIRQSKVPSVYVWPQYWGSEPLYFVLNKKHQALVAPLEQALTQMENEGVIKKYYAEMLKAKGILALKN
jgi:polar amino acid transport system substrate-binding protein